ncbi:MAG: hypothetical protein R3C53_19265 [Pirellulaceae bacterium]
MAKQRKRKIPRRRPRPGEQTSSTWQQGHEFHIAGNGQPPDSKMLEQMTNEFRESIRNSPIWQQMVDQFGAERAEQMLLEIRGEVRQ